jgi:hypothetical protein
MAITIYGNAIIFAATVELFVGSDGSQQSGKKNEPPKSRIDKELVEQRAKRWFGDKKLMFSPCGLTSSVAPLNINSSLLAEN